MYKIPKQSSDKKVETLQNTPNSFEEYLQQKGNSKPRSVSRTVSKPQKIDAPKQRSCGFFLPEDEAGKSLMSQSVESKQVRVETFFAVPQSLPIKQSFMTPMMTSKTEKKPVEVEKTEENNFDNEFDSEFDFFANGFDSDDESFLQTEKTVKNNQKQHKTATKNDSRSPSPIMHGFIGENFMKFSKPAQQKTFEPGLKPPAY